MNKLILKFPLVCFSLLSVLMLFGETYSQGRANNPKQKNQTRSDGYWSAQRNMETALAMLESFIASTDSDDPRQQIASEQIQMLKEIRLAPGKNDWAMLVKNYLNRAEMEWRVASVETNSDYTKAVIEIRNVNSESERCFDPLTELSLIDNRGQYVPMIRAGEIPRNIRIGNVDGRTKWCLMANQLIVSSFNFAPLAAGTTSGLITYRSETGTGTKPMKFSLFQQRLK